MAGAANKAVLLLSGGLDSITAGAIAREQGYAVYGLSFDYGQRHRVELEAAKAVAAHLGCPEHKVVTFSLREWGGSALTDSIDVPKDRETSAMGASIPVTYVPARNTIFLAFALGYAEVIGARDIFIGANAIDYSGYPDCRPAFLEAFARLANVATKAGVEGDRFQVHAPLLELTKAAIIRRGLELGVDYGITHSCYDPTPEGRACGRCDSCLLRLRAFREVGVTDPVPYQHSPDGHS